MTTILLTNYDVEIYINGEKWGDYSVMATESESACFIAGLRYKADKGQAEPAQGSIMTAHAQLLT